MFKVFYQHHFAGNLACFVAEQSFTEPTIQAFAEYYKHDVDVRGASSPGPVLRGWAAYYQAAYEQAVTDFQQELAMESEWYSYALLGLGKVASDQLCFDLATGYIKQALELARRENDFVRLTEGYGALGEVAFRTGNYQVAYQLFSLDKTFLLPGSAFEHRLNNYIANCAGRLGHFEWATMRLKANYFTSLKTNPISSDYSLASLFMCAWFNDQKLDDCFELLSKHTFSGAADMSEGVIELIRFWRSDDSTLRQAHLQKAKSKFSETYRIEYAYCEALQAYLEGTMPPKKFWYETVVRLPNVQMVEPSIFDNFVQICKEPNLTNYTKELDGMKTFMHRLFI